MNDPIQLLYLGPVAPDLSTSAYGPFVVHPLASRDELAAALNQQAYDAIVIWQAGASSLPALAAWPGLARAVLDTALVVVAPAPIALNCVRS